MPEPRLAPIAALLGLALAGSASAGHHNWDFTEIFSNADGSVQFIEMFSTGNNEAGVGPFTVTAGANSFQFVTNLPSTATANTWLLIGTTAFASLSGAPTPDYVLPDNFFSTAGGTLNYASGTDVWNYGAVPTDGVSSLVRDGSTPTNSPTAFPNVSGSVNANPVVPSTTSWALILTVGVLLLASSGVLRREDAVA